MHKLAFLMAAALGLATMLAVTTPASAEELIFGMTPTEMVPKATPMEVGVSAFAAPTLATDRLFGQNYTVVESVAGQEAASDRIFGQNYDGEFCARAFEERTRGYSAAFWTLAGRYPCHLYPASG